MKSNIEKMNKFKGELIRTGIIIGIFLVIIVCCRESLRTCFWSENVVKQTDNEIIYEPVEENKTYMQKFRCWGDMNHLQVFFDNCEENVGQIVVSVLDSKGNYIIPETECDLNMNGTGSVWLPICFSDNLKWGHLYTLTWYGKNISGDSTPLIECEKSNALFNNLTIDSEHTDKKLKITYVYNEIFWLKNVFITLIFLVLILLSSGLRINIPSKYYRGYREGILLLASIVNFLLVEYMNDGNITLWNVFTNVLILYIFTSFFCVIFSEKITVVLISCVCFVFGIANYYVTLYQGKPIVPWDLSGLQTAWNVSGSYNLELNFPILIGILVLILMLQILFRIETEKDTSLKHRDRVFTGLKCGILLGVFLIFAYPRISAELYDISGNYKMQGSIASFFSYMKYLNYKAPKGYSENECQDILEHIETEEVEAPVQAKNIIVIMNESFADFRIWGSESFTESYTPFMDSLQENVIKGNLYVPVFGGGTANTEFEFLTGASCAYVPSIPYSVHINKNMESICTSLEKENFTTIALHPGNPSSWNRDKVYSHMGFEDFLTLEDIANVENPEYSRIYLSDSTDYSQLIYDYENREEENYFMFNVTIQNHGGYEGEKEEFKSNADLSALGNFPYAENYLGLLQQSDAAFGELVKYFQGISEPTIICFFGDHNPNIEKEFYAKLLGADESLSAEGLQQKYMTPFLIWTNYDIEEQYIEKISSNYLYPLVKQTAGYSLDSYESFLYQLYQKYPVISVMGVWDNEGNFTSSVNNVEDELLSTYEKLQYYRMSGH